MSTRNLALALVAIFLLWVLLFWGGYLPGIEELVSPPDGSDP